VKSDAVVGDHWPTPWQDLAQTEQPDGQLGIGRTDLGTTDVPI
jgi:hypothetical protein